MKAKLYYFPAPSQNELILEYQLSSFDNIQEKTKKDMIEEFIDFIQSEGKISQFFDNLDANKITSYNKRCSNKGKENV